MTPYESRRHTRIYCPGCKVFHAAEQVDREGRSYWRIDCPHGPREQLASSDAELFNAFRRQLRPEAKGFRRQWSNCLLHITDACSLQCPVCFADAPRTGWRMPLDEVRAAARRLKRLKPYNVMLTGGEPSEHPDIVEIKLKAAERCFAANLNIGFVTTACRLNLEEIPQIIRYCIAHADKMSMYDIQVYQTDRRVVPGFRGLKWLRFFWCYLRHFGWRRLRLLRKWEGRRPSEGESLQMITIESPMTPNRLDACRIGHCTGGVVLADGSVCPPCFYYGLRYAGDKARRNAS